VDMPIKAAARVRTIALRDDHHANRRQDVLGSAGHIVAKTEICRRSARAPSNPSFEGSRSLAPFFRTEMLYGMTVGTGKIC
jgi:hypothetical protein